MGCRATLQLFWGWYEGKSMCAVIGDKCLGVCFPLSGVTYLLRLPEQKEFLWEHQSDENKKRELQVCIRGPGSQEQETVLRLLCRHI